jgi:hypothetical protein
VIAAELRERDLTLERHLTNLAARSIGLRDAASLSAFADHRAWPGGVRLDLDPIREIREELADARNYAVWGIERIYQRFLAGDPDVLDEYGKLMDCLSNVCRAWEALR